MRNELPWYFAYGSNMNSVRMQQREIVFQRALSASIAGLRMVFDKRGALTGEGHANLIVDRAAVAEGVLYELAAEDELRKLDRFERTPINYSREILTFATAEGQQAAWVYLANPGARSRGLVPSAGYLAHLLAGRSYLSTAYWEQLGQQPVLPGSEQSG